MSSVNGVDGLDPLAQAELIQSILGNDDDADNDASKVQNDQEELDNALAILKQYNDSDALAENRQTPVITQEIPQLDPPKADTARGLKNLNRMGGINNKV